MKTTVRNRVLAAIMALVMICSVIPMSVFASEGAPTTATLVTDGSALGVGDQVVIAAIHADYALGTNQGSNNRDGVAITRAGAELTFDSTVQVLTLEQGTKEGTFALQTGSGYLYAASSDKNYLRTKAELDDNGSWHIDIDASGVATIKAQGSVTRNWMRYNPNTSNNRPLFACYGSGQQDIAVYLVSKGSEGGTTPEPSTPAQPDPSTPVEPQPSEPVKAVVSIATALAGSTDSEFTVKGVVTLVDGKNLYLQDDTGAICLRVGANQSADLLGKTIVGTGIRADYNGLPQLGDGSYELSEGLVLRAKDTTISGITIADLCGYVRLTGVTITEVYDNNGGYKNPNITVTDDSGKTIQLYKAVVEKVEDAWQWKVGDVIDVTAAVGQYNGNPQLRNTVSTEITAHVEGPSDPIPQIPEGVLSLKEANAAAQTGVTVIGQVVYHYGKVYNGGESLNSIILEDVIDGEIVGFQIYDYKNHANYVVGDIVQVTGDITNYNGVMQMSSPSMTVVGNAPAIPAQEVTVSQLGADYLSEYVCIKNVTLGTYNTNNTPVTDASGTINLYGGAPLPTGATEENVTELYACCSAYKTTYQLRNGRSTDYVTDLVPAGPIEVGSQVVLFNLSAQGVLSLENDKQSITNVPATITEGKALVSNGGVIFTVEQNGAFYRFYNETFGYLCSNGTGNNAFYSLEVSEDADWTLAPQGTGYTLESRTAKYNGKYSQYLEYYSDSYKTYSMYNVTDYDIYTFQFYPVANDAADCMGGVVNKPAVEFGTLVSANEGLEYTFSFTVDAVFGVKEVNVSLGEQVLQPNDNGSYTIPANLVAGELLAITVTGCDNKDVAFAGTAEIPVVNEPMVTQVSPASGTETGEDKRPIISAQVWNVGENPTISMTVNDQPVEAVFANQAITYQPAEDLPDGRTTITVTITREDGKSVSRSWAFLIGEAQFQLYFGQLHSHTTYSDGSGSLESALEYIDGLPSSANVDFVAFTDHSNYFDEKNSANPEGALYDMSLATAYSQEVWSKYKNTVAEFNNSGKDVIAIAGFEMTWSGGPGHMNTFNTPGIVSRNNSVLNNKTDDAGMQAYYKLLSQDEGVNSISQFNHPGSTFGTFADFAYWNPVIDSRIFLVEVGNGEGQIGAGGYFPSYEYYTMALDKGWHVAPTNNQDNHKGEWGNANNARDVVLTDDFSEEGIYQAIRDLRVYATEDKNLEIQYSVNGKLLGSVIEEVPEKLELDISLYDPDATDTIKMVEVIVNSGKVAYTWSNASELATGSLRCTLEPDYSYYYIRVTQDDGDTAVTAPVWVGKMLMLGISGVESGTALPVTDEELTLTTTLFNSESTAATVKSLTYTINGSEVIGTDTTGYTIDPSTTLDVSFPYTPTKAKVSTITVTAVVEQNGKEYIFTKSMELDVLDSSKLVYIGVDAAHYNEYVAGNYKDSMGNFAKLAVDFSVRVNMLNTSEELIAACSNDKYVAMILTAPSRRLPAAQEALKVYTDAELNAIVSFNNRGGTVILAGWSDHYEDYPEVFGAGNVNLPAEKHMAATQNAVLEALGSSLRISDDATYDDSYNGGQAYRLYFNSYGDSFLNEGVIVDDAHPHDRYYTEVFSQYGGATIYTTDGKLSETVTPVVFGHSTTYSVDTDKDGLGGNSVPKYSYADGDDRLMVMATEELEGKGLIIVSGAAFMSNFEVQAELDNAAEKNYSNYRICENLVQYLNPITITNIADVQAENEKGIKFTIEGVVTSNASGFDKDTAFFDCIYLQDGTAGINAFPVSGTFQIGDKVRITGTTSSYQGERQIAVSRIKLLSQGHEVTPTQVTAAQINDGSVLGSLVTLKGTVTSFALENGLVQTIMVKDANGNEARVFIDGYITTDQDVENLTVGCDISVTGLASYDSAFEGVAPRIRIRNRADVVCTPHESGGVDPDPGLPEPPAQYTITLLTQGNGTASASAASAVAGTQVTLAAATESGNHFLGWFSSDVTISNDSFLMPAQDVTILAVFEEHSYAYTSNGDGTHTGTCSCGELVVSDCTMDGGTCQAPASCALCGAQGQTDPGNHASQDFVFTSNGKDSHTKAHACCGVIADADEAHTFVNRKCSSCGERKRLYWSERPSEHVHTMVLVEAQAPDCTNDGNIEHWRCTGCDKLYADEAGTEKLSKSKVVVKAIGHDYDDQDVCIHCGEQKSSFSSWLEKLFGSFWPFG